MSTVLGVIVLARNGDRREFYQDPKTYEPSLTDSTALGVVRPLLLPRSMHLISPIDRPPPPRHATARDVPHARLRFVHLVDLGRSRGHTAGQGARQGWRGGLSSLRQRDRAPSRPLSADPEEQDHPGERDGGDRASRRLPVRSDGNGGAGERPLAGELDRLSGESYFHTGVQSFISSSRLSKNTSRPSTDQMRSRQRPRRRSRSSRA